MPTSTKNPTTTTVIVAGWSNPTYAYSENGVNTTASPPDTSTLPEQKYGGWGFTTSDIPEGSAITKVEMGAKHYETDPSGYRQYTNMKHVNSGGTHQLYQLTRYSSLAWEWKDITNRESSWDLTKLNNADVRIQSQITIIGGGCYVETDSEKTYVLVQLEAKSFTVKPVSELKIGDQILIWEQEKGMMFSPVAKMEAYDLKAEDVIEIWSGTINLKGVTASKRDYIFTPHTTNTKKHPIPVYRKEGKEYAGPFVLTAEELHEKVYAGEQYWIGHLWHKWTVEMFPIVDVVRKNVKGKAYKVVPEDSKCYIFTKSLKDKELEDLSKEGLTLKKQAELGPPFMIEISKTTSYVDVVALRVTYTEPSAVKRMHGDGLTCVVA